MAHLTDIQFHEWLKGIHEGTWFSSILSMNEYSGFMAAKNASLTELVIDYIGHKELFTTWEKSPKSFSSY